MLLYMFGSATCVFVYSDSSGIFFLDLVQAYG